MNRVLLILGVAVIALSIYIWMKPNRKNPVIDLPDVGSAKKAEVNEVTKAPDMSSVKTEDIEVGTGTEAKEGTKVSVQYKGTLTDGTEFDSSYSRNNTPLEFKVGAGEMIKGFDYGVRGMKVGGTRKITIPPEFGYGNRKVGSIPENSTLIFEVKLEKVE